MEEVKDQQHRLLDISQSATPSSVALPINEALLNLAKMIWQMSATITPMCERVSDKKYYVPLRTLTFYFPIPHLISL